jgi:uncharacterized protein YjbI with pentapeptide repeats
MTRESQTAAVLFDITDVYGDVLHTANIVPPLGATRADKLGLAVRQLFETGADLRCADLCGAILRGATLCGATLCGADLSGATLRGADLRGADLCGAILRGADLRGADLCGAILRGANLCRAILRGADLRDSDLARADLRDADLARADLGVACWRFYDGRKLVYLSTTICAPPPQHLLLARQLVALHEVISARTLRVWQEGDTII